MAGSRNLTLHRPAPTGLVRQRLVSRLSGSEAPGLGLVIAPPGAGKTTLLARAADVGACTAWCPLGPEDRSGVALTRHLAAALLAATADAGDHASVPPASLLQPCDTALAVL